jgi:hypothetical protein
MDILVLYQGTYGQRISDNLKLLAPKDWKIEVFILPVVLPVIVDEPEEFLPKDFPSADLLLYLAESSRAAQLLPAAVQLSGACAVIAPIDNNAWIPAGLQNQLRREARALSAVTIFPEPFCTLTEESIHQEGDLTSKQQMVLLGFLQHFGRPRMRVILDEEKNIGEVIIERSAACGSSQYAAERLRGVPASEAVPQGGLICLHYPCLASMKPTRPKDGVENLMHLSGVIFNEELEIALQQAKIIDNKNQDDSSS